MSDVDLERERGPKLAEFNGSRGADDEVERLRARVAELEAELVAAKANGRQVAEEGRENARNLLAQHREDIGEIVELRGRIAETDRTAMVRSFLSEITPEQERLDRPGVPSPTTLRFRVRLVLDEVAEMLDELYDDRAAVDQLRACFSWFLNVSNWRRELYTGKGLAKVAREATDVAYAIEGLLATCGIDGTAVFRLVDSSNVAKKGAERDASGKIGKPSGWIAPDVEGELRRQGWKE